MNQLRDEMSQESIDVCSDKKGDEERYLWSDRKFQFKVDGSKFGMVRLPMRVELSAESSRNNAVESI